MKGFLKMLFGSKGKRKTVEFVPGGMLPTAPPGDDGQGWYEVPGGMQRDVRVTGSSPGPEYSEGSPGVWHKKDEA